MIANAANTDINTGNNFFVFMVLYLNYYFDLLDYIFSKRFNSGYIFFKILLKREAIISVAGHITFVLQEESFFLY